MDDEEAKFILKVFAREDVAKDLQDEALRLLIDSHNGKFWLQSIVRESKEFKQL